MSKGRTRMNSLDSNASYLILLSVSDHPLPANYDPDARA
jgi:hypothetical protein